MIRIFASFLHRSRKKCREERITSDQISFASASLGSDIRKKCSYHPQIFPAFAFPDQIYSPIRIQKRLSESELPLEPFSYTHLFVVNVALVSVLLPSGSFLFRMLPTSRHGCHRSRHQYHLRSLCTLHRDTRGQDPSYHRSHRRNRSRRRGSCCRDLLCRTS